MKKKLPSLDNALYALHEHIDAAAKEVAALSEKMCALQRDKNQKKKEILAKKIEARKAQVEELKIAAKIVTRLAKKNRVPVPLEAFLPKIGFESVNAPETKIMRVLFNRNHFSPGPIGLAELSGIINKDVTTTQYYLSALEDEGYVSNMIVKHKDVCMITQAGEELVWSDMEKFGVDKALQQKPLAARPKNGTNGAKAKGKEI